MSSKYWEKHDIIQWFQPDRWLSGGDVTQYREYLRGGNEDLDPCMKYVCWWPMFRDVQVEGSKTTQRVAGQRCAKNLQVRVGRDLIDAVDFGCELQLPLVCIWTNDKDRALLVAAGFDLDKADDLFAWRAFHKLWDEGAVPKPVFGYNIDVEDVWAKYMEIQWWDDSIPEKDLLPHSSQMRHLERLRYDGMSKEDQASYDTKVNATHDADFAEFSNGFEPESEESCESSRSRKRKGGGII